MYKWCVQKYTDVIFPSYLVLFRYTLLMWLFADAPSDAWTVPSYLAWPTALRWTLAHWITILSRAQPDLVNNFEKTKLYQLGKQHHTIPGLRCICLRRRACFPGLAGWIWSGRLRKYGAGPEWWWSWSRPATEATWELWGTRCSHRPQADTRRAWGCSPPSSWLYYKKRRMEYWIWKLWACSPESLLLASTCHFEPACCRYITYTFASLGVSLA